MVLWVNFVFGWPLVVWIMLLWAVLPRVLCAECWGVVCFGVFSWLICWGLFWLGLCSWLVVCLFVFFCFWGGVVVLL